MTVTLAAAAALRLMVKVKSVVPLSPSVALTSLIDRPGSGTPATVIEKSSMARPSSAPVALKSVQRMQNVAPLAIEPLFTVAGLSTSRFAAALPSRAPAVPPRFGAV